MKIHSTYRKLDKAMFASLLMLAWPTILESLLETVVQYVDTAMVGHLGAEATATVSLSSTYTWLINSVMSAIGIGFLAYIARAIGEKNEKKVQKAAGQTVLVTLAAGVILMAVTFVIAPFMPVWMGADEAIRSDATLYFICINAPMVFRAATIIFGAAIRSTGDTKSPMIVNLIVNLINIVLNYILIYPCGMGAIGAGVSSAISFVAGGILMTKVLIKNQTLGVKKENIHLDRAVLAPIMAIGVPVMLNRIMSCSGYIVATSFVSSMATTVYAAHSIAITAEEIFYIPGYGMQAATSTLIGNAIGEQNKKKERSVILIAILVIFSVMCITGLLLFVGAEFMMRLFTTDPEVIQIGSRLLRIVAFTEPIFGTTAVMEGIYNGMGRTKYPFVVELISRWGVRIFGSFLVVRVFGLGITQVWYCMIGDNILKAVLMAAGLFRILHFSIDIPPDGRCKK